MHAPLKRRPNALRSYGVLGDLITPLYDTVVLGIPAAAAVSCNADLDAPAASCKADLAAKTADGRPSGAAGPLRGLVQRLRSLPEVLLSSLTLSFVDKKAAATMLQHFQDVDARSMTYFGDAIGQRFADERQEPAL